VYHQTQNQVALVALVVELLHVVGYVDAVMDTLLKTVDVDMAGMIVGVLEELLETFS
jgi:hypothetical protein